MSFSAEIKEELNSISNLANKEAVKFEFLGYLATNHVIIETEQQKNKLKFSTESEYNINRFSKLLNNLNLANYDIQIVGKTYSITVQLPKICEIEYIDNNILLNQEKIKSEIKKQELLQKAFLRGAFLGSGSMNDPKRSYHLEMVFSNKQNADLALEILQEYHITLKQINKKQGYGIYAKDGEEISKLLAFIGANNAVLKFEEIRVYREIRNNVNRKVNCETANLNRTVNTALKQIEAIQNLKQRGILEKLPQHLQEIAELRIAHPEASLAELGAMLKEPIGKSGVNHRLNVLLGTLVKWT